jgi:hypothetical protein
MRLNRNLWIVAVVVVGLIGAFFATRSNGDDGGNVDATSSQNCSPVARMDAAATTPAAPVLVDVLANDTDPDGDPLVFQILKATGGTAVVDDGATPTEAGDDRVQFTPAVPAPPAAVVEYQAVDPAGASATSTIEVAINDLGTLPEGLRSEPVTTDETGAGAGRCGTPSPTTGVATTFSDLTTTTFEVSAEEDDTTPTTRRRTTTTTKKKSSTTTTAKKTTTTTSGGGPGPTNPPTTSPPTTTPPTTQPGNTTTTTNPCGPPPAYVPPDGGPAWNEWRECQENN